MQEPYKVQTLASFDALQALQQDLHAPKTRQHVELWYRHTHIHRSSPRIVFWWKSNTRNTINFILKSLQIDVSLT